MKTLKDIKLGTPILVHYKDGRAPEWFEWGGFTFDKDEIEKHVSDDGFAYDGFVMFGKPIRDTKGILLPSGEMCYVMLFPETIEKIDVEDGEGEG